MRHRDLQAVHLCSERLPELHEVNPGVSRQSNAFCVTAHTFSLWLNIFRVFCRITSLLNRNPAQVRAFQLCTEVMSSCRECIGPLPKVASTFTENSHSDFESG